MSYAESMAHLELANGVRLKRARLLRDVKKGRRSVRKVITDPPDFMLTCELRRVLSAQTRWGTRKTEKLCQRLGIRSTWQLGDLSDAARDRLDRAL